MLETETLLSPCLTCGADVIRTDNDVVLDPIPRPVSDRSAIWSLTRLGTTTVAMSVAQGATTAYRMHEHQAIPARPGPDGFATLGWLISELEKLPADGTVQFDFSGLSPGRFYSWRMDYAQLCLSPFGKWPVKTGVLLEQAREAVGKTFSGWKGGDYTMDEQSTIVIADAGVPGGCYGIGYTTIVGVVADGDEDAVLVTAEVKTDG